MRHYGIGKEKGMSVRLSFYFGKKCLTIALFPKLVRKPKIYYYNNYNEWMKNSSWFFGLRIIN